MKHSRSISMNQHSEFVLCREKGRSKAGKFLVVSTYEGEEVPRLKCAYITTKKVGKAHERNALRRRFRHIMQQHGDKIAGKRYVVTIARWRAKEASYEELERDWLKQAKRLGMLNDDEKK